MNNTHESELLQQLRAIDAEIDGTIKCLLFGSGVFLALQVIGLNVVSGQLRQLDAFAQVSVSALPSDQATLAMAP